MAQCNRCGKSGPVLVSPPTPQAQEFRGCCKPCIMSELRNRHEDAQRMAAQWINGLFNKIFD